VDSAVKYYGTIRAKNNYAQASSQLVEQAKRDYLPNLVIAAQQDYGSINGQNGPLYGFGGLAASSSGLPLPTQNWNAAFGALYLANINWEFFAFGRADQKIKLAKVTATKDEKDFGQELFQHKIKVAAAYLKPAGCPPAFLFISEKLLIVRIHCERQSLPEQEAD
jgi:outer membrane protein TolC